MPGSRRPGRPLVSPLSSASGTAARTPATRASRSAASWAARSGCSRTATSTAAANPASAGVSRVPERTSRSWPPPCSSGTGARARLSSKAPTPRGPPSLCPVTVSASTPAAAKSTGTWPTAWTASVCMGTPAAWATSASSATGCTVPTSLLAHITLTRATPSGSRARAARSTSGATRPSASTGSHSASAPSWSTSQCTASRTAWCSTALARIRRRRGASARRAQNRPFTARLSASVPPDRNTTSLGRAPRACAIRSRDSSTTRRARRPEACSEDGLPTWANSAVMAATASGRIGVLAAWSR